MKPLFFFCLLLLTIAGSAQGPYVFYSADSVIIQTTTGRTPIAKSAIGDKKVQLLIEYSGIKQPVPVILDKDRGNEPSIFTTNEKLLVLSDIEGEFDGFRKLMLQHGVMDSMFNWTFGKNHLVLVGDHFDRGNDVIPYLWLLYRLDRESRLHGGYVHVILGNHDIMNLNGDFRYVQPKYFEEAKSIGKEYHDLFTSDTELGRWLRTKNIIEKINDRLFVHAGISPEVNKLGMTIEQINNACRPWFDQRQVPDSVAIFFDGATSPFWYRGYFKDPQATEEQINETLQLFGVKQIVVGHTIVPKIQSLYNNKVLAVDVNHHLGVHEAILLAD